MSFNFNEFLKKGSEAAEQIINNRNEINAVISEVKTSLTQFLEVGLLLIEEAEYENEFEHLAPASPAYQTFRDMIKRQTTGFTKVSIISDNEKIKDKCYLFKLKRSADGYPITVAKNDFHLVAENQSELARAIGEILADAQTHIQLKQFVRRVKAIPEK